MPNLPSIVITPIAPIATTVGVDSPLENLQIANQSLTLTQARDIWSDFLSLKISANTQRAYASAIADFYRRVYDESVSAGAIAKFLTLPASEALFQVLNYRRMLIEAKLAPSTINVRLSALKSLVDYSRKMGECAFSLDDVPGLKTETYRDTTGIDAEAFKGVIGSIDVSTVGGARDYAILRLLWDNALRRGEVCSLDLGDFRESERKLMILGKGKIAKSAIDLSSGATAAIAHWLELRGNSSAHEPMFISLSRNQPGHRLGGSAVYALVRQYFQEKDIAKMMSPHRVRHSALTAHLNASDGNIRAAQALSRHADIKTLTLYDDNRHQYQKGASDLLSSLLD
ncbi:MAG: tyrosine-type recombinase/integrase [Chamaesiphon sp.]|nr:tyrosine-type recombinase/integrase [Chamaesiphon sp.]